MPSAFLELAAEDGAVTAHAAWPEDGRGPWPPVLLLSDARGLSAGLITLAQRLAAQGRFVLSPDLFHADDTRSTSGVALSPSAQAADFELWLGYLETEVLAAAGRVSVIGYGVGGALAVRLAATHPRAVGAVASFYGGAPAGPMATLLAQHLRGPLHLGFPADDLWANSAAISGFEQALSAAGLSFEVEFYPAGHGFALEGGSGYERRAARLHWTRLNALLERELRTDHQPRPRALICRTPRASAGV